MRVGVVVGRELGFDIRQRDVAADADVHALGDVRDVEVEVVHHGVVAVLVVAGEELLREDALGGGVAIVLAPELGDAEAPVEVLGLDGVGDDARCRGLPGPAMMRLGL